MNRLIVIKPYFQSLIPPLTPDEYSQLEENILAEGCRDAIVIWQGVIVDGHNRYAICVKHDIPFKTIEKEFDNNEQVEEWIIRNQFGRRNLTDWQRSKLALKLKPSIETKARENQGVRNDLNIPQKSAESFKPIDTREQLAQIAGVSHDTIHKVETIQNEAPEPIKEALESNEISINKAHNITRQVKDLPEEEKAKKAEQLLTEQKQAKKSAKTGKSTKKQEPVSVEESVEPDVSDISEDLEPVRQDDLAEIAGPDDEEYLSAEQEADKITDTDIEEIEAAANIPDTPELLKILEQITSTLGALVGQAETAINQLSELGEYRFILGNYIEAIHKYAERLDSAWKLKLKEERRNAR